MSRKPIEGKIELLSNSSHLHPLWGDSSDGDSENTDYCMLEFTEDIIYIMQVPELFL